MRIRYPLALLLSVVMGLFPVRGAELNYATALAQSKADASNPAYEDWYWSLMYPAFKGARRQALAECLPLNNEGLPSIGQVLVLDTTGAVRQSVARGDSALDRCMQSKLSMRRYPAPPKPDFHVGYELEGSPILPRTP